MRGIITSSKYIAKQVNYQWNLGKVVPEVQTECPSHSSLCEYESWIFESYFLDQAVQTLLCDLAARDVIALDQVYQV